ncbi:MAG: S8 family serine peptidase [Chroococcidiopsidaceae cyanobacterium CP_BM_RX_35]|nr:S8 family serine peptidase [Chroococcidiopsidaceae cyanobacterium CP_BM_RX_35]
MIDACGVSQTKGNIAPIAFSKLVKLAAISITAAFGGAVASAQAADFSLPIQQAANATGVTSIRDNGSDGTGVTVGILSNSFNTTPGMNSTGTVDDLNYDISHGYLPPQNQIQIVKESTGPLSDEGRAIGQVIHAVAPGAKLLFYTAVNSQSDFGNGIQALKSAGANILVDDIQYVSEPTPPDGDINQAINTVVNQGVNYLTSAGNNDSGVQFTPLTIYGHASNPNAVTVGAAYEGNPTTSNFNYTGFSTTTVKQGQLEPFSKAGANSSSCSTSPDRTCKPDVVGPDGIPISFNLSGGSPSEVTNQGTFYDFFGTSASAPYTAGVAALLLQAVPQATNSQIYAAITQTATPLDSSSGFSSSSGYGLIHADKALTYLQQTTSVPEPSSFAGLIAFGCYYAGFLFLKRPISGDLQAKPFVVKPMTYKD